MIWGLLIGIQSFVFNLPKDQLDSELQLIYRSAEQISRAREILETELQDQNISFRKEESRFSFEESLQNLENAEQQLLVLQTEKEVELQIRRSQALAEVLKLYLKTEESSEADFLVSIPPIRLSLDEKSLSTQQSGFQLLIESFDFLSWSDRGREALEFNDRNGYREQFDLLLGEFRRALRDVHADDKRLLILKEWARTTQFRVVEDGQLEAIYRIDSTQ